MACHTHKRIKTLSRRGKRVSVGIGDVKESIMGGALVQIPGLLWPPTLHEFAWLVIEQRSIEPTVLPMRRSPSLSHPVECLEDVRGAHAVCSVYRRIVRIQCQPWTVRRRNLTIPCFSSLISLTLPSVNLAPFCTVAYRYERKRFIHIGRDQVKSTFAYNDAAKWKDCDLRN